MKKIILVLAQILLFAWVSSLSAQTNIRDDLGRRLDGFLLRMKVIQNRIEFLQKAVAEIPDNENPKWKELTNRVIQNREELVADLADISQKLRNGRFSEADAALIEFNNKINRFSMKLAEVEGKLKFALRKRAEWGIAHVQKAVERTDRILERHIASERYSQALEIQRAAKRKIDEKVYRAAYRLTLQAREMVLKNKDNGDGRDVEQASRLIDNLEIKAERVSEKLRKGRNDKARLIFEKGKARLEHAADLLESGNAQAALAEARIAAKLIAKAADTADRPWE